MRIRPHLFQAIVALSLATPIAACSFVGSSDSALSEEGSGNDAGVPEHCTFTQGYWKNHPDAWPVSSLELGTVSYSKEELLAIFKTPVKGNGLVALAHQLIAAKLNVAIGANDADIADAIADADALIGALVVPPVGDGHLPTNQTSGLNDTLDAFNNGKLGGQCEGAPDDDDCDHGDDGDCDGEGSGDEPCDHDTDHDGDCDGEQPPAPVCGNHVLETGEACDDGNTHGGDGCSATCTCEPPPS